MEALQALTTSKQSKEKETHYEKKQKGGMFPIPGKRVVPHRMHKDKNNNINEIHSLGKKKKRFIFSLANDESVIL